jgi:DNA mismatch repair protein MSH4
MYSFATYVTLSPESCCCPKFLEDSSLDHIQIVKGYHPLILARSNKNTLSQNSTAKSADPSSGSQTVPNDIKTSKKGAFCSIITGRNNSGKTTYLLQIGTLIVMAHMGCYIPASFASLSLVDRLLTRISSQDVVVATSDPMANSSAFYKEMCDTAYILHSASPKSVILLDEIGRSTSSDDGVPICLAICESLIERKITTFFATHFLDMASKLQDLYPEVLVHTMTCNQTISSLRGDSSIQYSFRMEEGVQDDSAYGIDLASDAGWPSDTIALARYLRDHDTELHGNDRQVSIEYSRRAKMVRLQRNITEQILIAKRSNMDSVNLHLFLHKLATRYREKLNQITDQSTLT